MKLISRVTCPDGIDDCDYALVNLTPDLARLALKRIAVLNKCKASDPDLFELYYWDRNAQYFNPWLAQVPDEADRLAEMIETLPAASTDLLRVPNHVAIPADVTARVECSQMVACDDAIRFLAIPKYTDVYVETAEIPLTVLHEAASGELPGRPPSAPGA